MSLSTVSECMSPFPHHLEPSHSVRAAHRLMERHSVRHLPVLLDGKLVGLVHLRDLYLISSLRGTEDEAISVEEAMEQVVLQVSPTDGAVSVCRRMAEARVDVALVVDDQRVVGIFTSHDALCLVASAEPR